MKPQCVKCKYVVEINPPAFAMITDPSQGSKGCRIRHWPVYYLFKTMDVFQMQE